MRRASLIIALLFALATPGQTIEQTAGIYYAYPQPSGYATPAPDGYKPFYISHYGRHGSRWVTEDKRYTDVLAMFDDTDNLTPLGADVRSRLEAITEHALGRSGSLSPIGDAQHHEIADRMYRSFPEVFADSASILAESSTAMRCAMSMASFTECLKVHNPSLRITREPYERHMRHISYVSPQAKAFSSDTAAWRKQYWEFVGEMLKPQRILSSLFINPGALSEAEQFKLVTGLYWIASDTQDVDLGISLYDIFSYEELRNMWRCINARMYVCNGPSPLADGVMAECASALLDDIIAKADDAVAGNGNAADLRFGHDTALLRLITLMGLDGCRTQETDMHKIDSVWRDYALSPMAANLQIVFFSNPQGDVICKFLLNEEETGLPIPAFTPKYYKWADVRDYLTGQCLSH